MNKTFIEKLIEKKQELTIVADLLSEIKSNLLAQNKKTLKQEIDIYTNRINKIIAFNNTLDEVRLQLEAIEGKQIF